MDKENSYESNNSNFKEPLNEEQSDQELKTNLYPDDYPNEEIIKENETYSLYDNEKIAQEDKNQKNQKTINSTTIDVPNKENRDCLGRWFAKIKGGSLRGSTFAMASITFGGGCLAFPNAIKKSGPLLGLIIFLIVAAFSYLTLRYLLDNGLKHKILDYDELVEKSAGKKMRIFADINNIILCIGVIMGYQYMIYNFTQQLLWDFFDLECNKLNKIIIMIVCILVFQIPLGLLKNISTLQYASILATFALMYAIIVIFIEMPFYLSEEIDYNKHPLRKFSLFPPELGWGWLDTIGIFLFGFCNHNGIFQVFMEMDRPSKRRTIKVTNRSMYIELVLYFVISFAGFFSLFYETPDVFIVRPDIKGFNDYFIKIAKLTLIIVLNCVMAINYNIMRMSVRSMVFDNKKPNWWADFFITVFTYLISNTIVFFVKDATTILGFIGGISTVVISFVCPIIIDIQLNGLAKNHWKNIVNMILLVVISIIGVSTTTKSVVDFVQNINNPETPLCLPKVK